MSPSTNPKSAAEINKPETPLLILSQVDVMQLLELDALLDALADGFRDLASGLFQTPPRPEVTVPNKGFLIPMPAWRPGSPISVKMVSVFEGNLDVNLPNHLAVINLFDAETGMPICFMDGTYITGVRTAGAAVLSVRELSRPGSKVATVVGAGVQGREHLKLLPLVRDFKQIFVSSLHFEDAQKLAELEPRATAVENLERAVKESDVVCLATHAYEPVINADWIQPGTHVTSVGYAPPNGELPPALARNHKLYVEDAAAFEEPPVGCGELRGIDPSHGIAFGDALLGNAPLRESDDEITVYKAMGIAMEDLVAAELVYNRAVANRSGTYANI